MAIDKLSGGRSNVIPAKAEIHEVPLDPRFRGDDKPRGEDRPIDRYIEMRVARNTSPLSSIPIDKLVEMLLGDDSVDNSNAFSELLRRKEAQYPLLKILEGLPQGKSPPQILLVLKIVGKI